MYRCERCGGTFERFKTAGQCPLCKVWAHVRCEACKHIGSANEFINNNDRCPKCGNKVSVPGRAGCFVATVAFANPDAPQVHILRSYRDVFLSQTFFGRTFIRAYYCGGPIFATIVSRSSHLTASVRALLCIVAKCCEKALAKQMTEIQNEEINSEE